MAPTSAEQACSVLYPSLGRANGSVRSHRIEGTTPAFLQNSVSLKLAAELADDELIVSVSIHNDQVGHHVPTGVTIRNMILLVEATRPADGAKLEHLGEQVVHELGGVGDPEQGYYAGLPGKLYAKINASADGKGPVFFTDAASIVTDNRIAALATDETRYTFRVPSDGGRLKVRARLIYRRSWRALTDQKQWTQDGHGNPLGDVLAPHFGYLMEEAETTLSSDAGAEQGTAGAGGAAGGAGRTAAGHGGAPDDSAAAFAGGAGRASQPPRTEENPGEAGGSGCSCAVREAPLPARVAWSSAAAFLLSAQQYRRRRRLERSIHGG
jgi:hypothetical protein